MKKKVDKICLLVLNILVFLVFLPWLKEHYATDTYNIMNVGYDYYSIHNSLIDGRLVMYGILQVANFFTINCNILSSVLLGLALLVSNISVYILKNLICEYIKDKSSKKEIFTWLISYTIIYNFMYIENLYFLESFVMALSILLIILAVKIFTKKKEKYILKTALLVTLSVFCYQGTIMTFLALVALFECLKNNKLKEIIKNICLCIIILILALGIDFAIIKLLPAIINIEQTRLSFSILDVLENLIHIVTTKAYNLVNTSGNFYAGLFVCLLGYIISFFCFSFRVDKNELLYFNFFIVLIIGICLSVDFPYLVTQTAFWAGRTRFAIGALIGILFVFILKNEALVIEKFKNTFNKSIYIFIAIYFILNVVNYVELINSSKIVNKCEETYVKNMGAYIEAYEKENNVTINVIQLIYDNENVLSAYCSNVSRYSVVTWNACSCSWSAVGVINFYTGRDLISNGEVIYMSMDENYKIENDILYVKLGVL